MYRYDKKENISYTLGTTLTFELLFYKSGQIQKIYINPKQKRDETFYKLEKEANRLAIPFITNNSKIFDTLSAKDNVMVIGEFTKFTNSIPKGNHLVLVNPMNQGNLGTIIRSAAAFNIDGIAIILPSCDLFDPKVIRGSMGAIFRVPIQKFENFENYQKTFKGNSLYPFMLQTNNPLKEAIKKEPYSLIFGNEATGLNPSFLEIGHPIKIEQSSKVDSLNLDNAVSIGLYSFLTK